MIYCYCILIYYYREKEVQQDQVDLLDEMVLK